MSKRFVAITLVVIGMLALASASVTFAQGGPGNGNGNGNGPGPYVHGGAGIVNENGEPYQRGQGGNRDGGFGIYSVLPPASTEPLSDDLIAYMTDGIMDEYGALAVYDSVIMQFGDVRPFINIQAAEQQHAEAWAFIFERYELDVPSPPESVDVPQFDSIADACQASVDAEIANFELYAEMYEAFEGYPDIQQVVISLSNASEYNHLPAFENCAQ